MTRSLTLARGLAVSVLLAAGLACSPLPLSADLIFRR